jgi:hypothetical protein
LTDYRFFKASVKKGDLDNFRQEIDRMYRKINTQLGICIWDDIDRKKSPSRRYPEFAGEYIVKLIYSV